MCYRVELHKGTRSRVIVVCEHIRKMRRMPRCYRVELHEVARRRIVEVFEIIGK